MAVALMPTLVWPSAIRAQNTGFPAPGLPWLPAPPEALQQPAGENSQADSTLFATRANEVRIDGTIRAINSARKRFVLETDLTVLRSESSGDLNSLPARTILVDRFTVLWTPSGEQVFDFALLPRGAETIVIGTTSPDGRFMRARLVALLQDVIPVAPQRHSKSKPIVPKPLAHKLVRRAQPQPVPVKVPVRTPKVLSRSAPTPSQTNTILPPKVASAQRDKANVRISKSPAPVIVARGSLSRAPWTTPSRSSPSRSSQVRVPDVADAQTLARPDSVVGLESRITPIIAKTRAVPRFEASKLSSVTTPAQEISPQKSATSGDSNVGAAIERSPARGVARLNTPAAVAPRTIPKPPTVSAPLPSSPVGRLATTFGVLDSTNVEAQTTVPLGDDMRPIEPPLDFHPNSQKARTQAEQERIRSTWQAMARPRFHASREAQRDIRFAYFSGHSSPTESAHEEKLVALTFDDGPHPANTLAVLDILKRERVPATFFVVGRNVEKHPELVLRAVAEGHEIANHTYQHLQRASMSVQEWTQEIDHNNRTIAALLGGAPRWFRAPGCRYSFAALQAINELGMIRVDTTNNSGDWEQPNPDAIVRRVLSRLAPGQVLLFHDTAPQTARALPQILVELKRRGYRCVGLTELAQRAQATPGFEPLWCPPGQGIVIAAPAPVPTASRASISTEAAHTVVQGEAPLSLETTP